MMEASGHGVNDKDIEVIGGHLCNQMIMLWHGWNRLPYHSHFVGRSHRSLVDSSHKRPVVQTFVIFFFLGLIKQSGWCGFQTSWGTCKVYVIGNVQRESVTDTAYWLPDSNKVALGCQVSMASKDDKVKLWISLNQKSLWRNTNTTKLIALVHISA